MLEKTQFSALLFSLDKLIRMAAGKYPAYREKIGEMEVIAQFKLRDNSQGRIITFAGGKVSSKTGIHADPDVVISFEDAATAVRLFKPGRSMLDFISAAKAFQVETMGSDEQVVRVTEIMNMLFHLDVDDGIDVGKGVKR